MTDFSHAPHRPLFGMGLLAALLTTLTEWNNARLTRRALSSLSDHELDDIGLCRGDIEFVTRA
jgi:uncharacterized protein YjiS (DUF1127 family)